jgi:hypothetical protein
LSERGYRKRKRRFDKKLGRKNSPAIPSKMIPRRAGGSIRRSSYIIRHNFRYAPEPKDKPKKEKLERYSKAEPWTEPSIKNQPKVIKYEVDTEKMIKELEKNFDEKLLNEVLEKMDDDSGNKAEIPDELEPSVEEVDSEKEMEKPEVEVVKDEATEGIEKGAEIDEDFLRDMYMGDEAEVLREMEASEDQIEGKALRESAETIEDIAEIEEPHGVEPESIGAIDRLEAEDLSPLEAEIFPEELESVEAEEKAEVEGH